MSGADEPARSREEPGDGTDREAAADVWVALCTAPDTEAAERLARLAVEGGHAACANLLTGVRSLYRWRGAIQDDVEVLILFKTTVRAYQALAELVSRNHPYEVPELIAFPLAAGLPDYLAWVREETGGVDSPRGTV